MNKLGTILYEMRKAKGISQFDQIFVISGGNIVEVGTFVEFLNQKNLFY